MTKQSSKDNKVKEKKRNNLNYLCIPKKEKVERRKFIVKGRLGGRKVKILIDSRFDLNCVSKKLMKRVGFQKEEVRKEF
jgi:hypothetical protein